jgi:hypothetical protein
MIAPFDVFRVDGQDAPVWVSSAASLDEAKAIINQLSKDTHCDYLILSQVTGHKMVIKASDGPT